MAKAGEIANEIAGRAAFSDYRDRKAANTRKRQDDDLALFADYLRAAGLPAGDFSQDPQAWQGMSWGLVAGFARWQLSQGYAVGTINVRLSTVKTYARLALQAGVLPPHEYTQIQTVKGYRLSEAHHIDEQRLIAGLATRRTTRARTDANQNKKAQPVSIRLDQAQALKVHPDTPQGRRDRLIMTLLLDHGLRVGELARLTVDNFDLKAGELRFYRPKVDKTQIHVLSREALAAARSYLASDAPALGSIWRSSASKRDGKALQGQLTKSGMSARALTERVTVLGALVGLAGLSAHDCRHYLATILGQRMPLRELMDFFGWSSPAMAMRYAESKRSIDARKYIEAAKVANEGVRLE
jgi:integrase